jgi:hypothetical protein
MLRGIFGPNWDEIIGGWRKLYSEELHNFYSSPSIIRTIKSRPTRRAGNVARMGEKTKAYRILVRNPEGKRPLGRPDVGGGGGCYRFLPIISECNDTMKHVASDMA